MELNQLSNQNAYLINLVYIYRVSPLSQNFFSPTRTNYVFCLLSWYHHWDSGPFRGSVRIIKIARTVENWQRALCPLCHQRLQRLSLSTRKKNYFELFDFQEESSGNNIYFLAMAWIGWMLVFPLICLSCWHHIPASLPGIGNLPGKLWYSRFPSNILKHGNLR